MEDLEASAGATTNQNAHGRGHNTHRKADSRRVGKVRTRARPMRRLNLSLSETLYEEIERLAEREDRSLVDVLRMGLSLAQLAVTEREKGGHLAVIDAQGNVHRIILSK